MPIVQAAGLSSGSGGTDVPSTSGSASPTNLVESAMVAATERYFETLKGPVNHQKLRDKKLAVRTEALRLMSAGCDPEQVVTQALAAVFPEK